MRDYAEDVFGLRDPIVVAVVSDSENGIFTPIGLEALERVHEYVAELDNVRADRTISIKSESRIQGTDNALLIDPFFDDAPKNQADANRIREQVFASDPHIGSLVAESGKGALIVAELHDESLAGETYETISKYANSLEFEGVTFL